ncbi:MAG: triose-phosphate isomerase [Candidatus Heimdallarchaeota archaeon]
MPRKPCIMANWKMNLSLAEATDFAEALGKDQYPWADVVICPPIYISPLLSNMFAELNPEIKVGAQNMYHKPQGAFTAEISSSMVKDAGCSYVILGHSERRHIFGETDEDIALRLKAALDSNLIPVICIGEKLEQRKAGKTQEVNSQQLLAVMPILKKNSEKKFLIAYEPVWAIGTGLTATPDQAQEVQNQIRQILVTELGKEIAENVQILYGGSVKPENATELLSKEDVDGFLVGGASLKAGSFSQIIQCCKS